MALRIHRVKPPYNPPQAEPDAMYATKIRGVLKPLHPFLVFDILKMDLGTTVDFRIGFRDLVIGGKDINAALGKPFIMGTFPGFWFDRAQAKTNDFERLEMFKLFEQYVFKCLFNFVSDVLGHKSVERRKRMTLFKDEIAWSQVLEFLNLLTESLPMFDRRGDFTSNSNYLLIPKRCQTITVEGGLKKVVDEPWMWPVDIAGFDKAALQAQVQKFAQDRGEDYANWKLKQHLTNLLVQSLYYCLWNFDDNPS